MGGRKSDDYPRTLGAFYRRYDPMAAFASLLGLGTSQSPTTADEVRAPLPGAGAKRAIDGLDSDAMAGD